MTRSAARATLLAAVAVGVLLATASPASARNPCKRWGTDKPSTLSHAHARAAITCFINRAREKRDRRRLDRSDDLQHAAQEHTDYMKKKDCFRHRCKDEASHEGRVTDAGYLSGQLAAWEIGENLAYGGRDAGTPKEIFRAWMESKGHRKNILKRRFRDIGVGFAFAHRFKDAKNAGIYTADFGYRQT